MLAQWVPSAAARVGQGADRCGQNWQGGGNCRQSRLRSLSFVFCFLFFFKLCLSSQQAFCLIRPFVTFCTQSISLIQVTKYTYSILIVEQRSLSLEVIIPSTMPFIFGYQTADLSLVSLTGQIRDGSADRYSNVNVIVHHSPVAYTYAQ